MENVKRFAKRMDVWSEYRLEIERKTLKSNSGFSEDRKLKKMLENINDIDEAIINYSTKQELELTQVQTKKYGIHDHYKLLKIKLENLDHKTLEDIEDGIKAANDIKGRYFCLDAKQELNSPTLQKFDNQDIALQGIHDRLEQVKTVVNHFPETAQVDLAELNTILEQVKIKIENQEEANRVKTKKVNLTYDLKKIYIIVIWSILVIAIICFILAICLIWF